MQSNDLLAREGLNSLSRSIDTSIQKGLEVCPMDQILTEPASYSGEGGKLRIESNNKFGSKA